MKCDLCRTELPAGDDGQWTTDRFVCQACYDKPRHRYYYTLRPPMTGTQPDGWIDRMHYGVHRREIEGLGIRAHGEVFYIEPLTNEQIWRYDLLPADEAERKAYVKWCRKEGYA